MGSNKAGFLELLEAVADVLGSTGAGGLGEGSSAVFATIVASETSGADATSDVELVGKGRSTGVEPVGIIRSKLLEAGGLNVRLPL